MPAAKQVKKEPKDKETADNLNRTSNKPTCSTSLLKAATLASKGCWLPTKPCQDSLTKRENFWRSGPRTRLANGTLPGRKQWLLLSKRQWASALVSELLEMPPESKEFKAVEKALEVAGLCDDAWDENDVTQEAYKKRSDMSKVQSTWSKLDKSQEKVSVDKTGKEVDKQLSTVLGSLGSNGSGSKENAGPAFWPIPRKLDTAAPGRKKLQRPKTWLQGWNSRKTKPWKTKARNWSNGAERAEGDQAGEGLELKDFSGQSILNAAKARVSNVQEYHTKAKSKVRTSIPLLWASCTCSDSPLEICVKFPGWFERLACWASANSDQTSIRPKRWLQFLHFGKIHEVAGLLVKHSICW